MKYLKKAWKTLSRNDTGETHSHQSGISIIKDIAWSGIFPTLTTEYLNPRTEVKFKDEEGYIWSFQYIYYNDIFFGKPREKGHNEFRLTCVKDFIQAYDIKAGDEIWFALDEDGNRVIGFNKAALASDESEDNDDDVIVIRHGWKMINI